MAKLQEVRAHNWANQLGKRMREASALPTGPSWTKPFRMLLARIQSLASSYRRDANQPDITYSLRNLCHGEIPEALTLKAFNGLYANFESDGMSINTVIPNGSLIR